MSTTSGVTTLRKGDSTPQVVQLQQRLLNAGYQIAVDGEFGPATEQAVKRLQQAHGLVVDGIVGPKTQAALAGKVMGWMLSQRDLQQAADDLDVDLAAIQAVNTIESNGAGFLADGRPVILFERHIMHRRLKHHGLDANALQVQYPALVHTQPGGYKSATVEHYRLKMATDIHPESALESASWGLFQIMGFHWHRLGYETVQAFVAAMETDEASQLNAFVRFIKADSKLHQALKDHDWPAFARIYNGPKYKKNHYDTRLADAWQKYNGDAG
ncbi:MAG: N-acetylmuramidase family protein [Marinobacterium sp.]|nr:N-acetylmuramidase family protein [Marinobacterium sp.]